MFGLGAAVTAIFGAWPIVLWGETDLNGWSRGIIWVPPNAGNDEYGWHGLQLIVGNAYVLTGLALFIALLVMAGRQIAIRHPAQSHDQTKTAESCHVPERLYRG
jgi:hypothetical protein